MRAVVSLLLLPLLATQVVSPTKFSGEVTAGKGFEREFGPGLVFRLRPVEDPAMPGWEIEVVSKDSPSGPEYSYVVTLPYHGFNQRYLWVGYSFTARDIVSMTPRG